MRSSKVLGGLGSGGFMKMRLVCCRFADLGLGLGDV